MHCWRMSWSLKSEVFSLTLLETLRGWHHCLWWVFQHCTDIPLISRMEQHLTAGAIQRNTVKNELRYRTPINHSKDQSGCIIKLRTRKRDYLALLAAPHCKKNKKSLKKGVLSSNVNKNMFFILPCFIPIHISPCGWVVNVWNYCYVHIYIIEKLWRNKTAKQQSKGKKGSRQQQFRCLSAFYLQSRKKKTQPTAPYCTIYAQK